LAKKINKVIVDDSNSQHYVIGISSHENDYRICWALNNSLKLKLAKIENHCAIDKANNKKEFSVFVNNDEEKSCCYKLVSNICPEGYLIDEMKTIDFFLFISDEIKNKGLWPVV